MLLIYILIIGVVLWLITYLIDVVPMEVHFKAIAKVVVIVIGVIFLILLLIRCLPALPLP
jgi:hypothetical protein